MSSPPIVYFSSVSGNTRRFVDKLCDAFHLTALRIPLRRTDPPIAVTGPYVLIVPTYGGGDLRGAVPKQVIRFLNVPAHRASLKGVITSGNTNFGAAYCCAGPRIAAKCGVPELHRFELLGTRRDVEVVGQRLAELGLLPPRPTDDPART